MFLTIKLFNHAKQTQPTNQPTILREHAHENECSLNISVIVGPESTVWLLD